MNDETIRAGAEATQAIAETGGKGLDLIGKFAKYFDGALTQRGGIAEDNMIFRRAKNRLRILEETEAILQARGIESHSQDVPLKIALPLLTFGSLEEDQSLQKTWARMLANALDANSGVDMRTAYVDILKDLTAFSFDLGNPRPSDAIHAQSSNLYPNQWPLTHVRVLPSPS